MEVLTGDRSVGFESSRVARRRLAALAATNERVQEALSPSQFPGLFAGEHGAHPALGSGQPADLPQAVLFTDRTAERVPASAAATNSDSSMPAKASQGLLHHLDDLACDIVSTPGAGGALLAAYAAQARALSMVVEAASRATDAPLPPSVLQAARAALIPPHAFPGLALL
jgi:hypothetical protein